MGLPDSMPTLPDVATSIAACELFSQLPPQHRGTIAGICRIVTVQKNEPLFLEGRPGAAMYILATGAVQLVKTSPDGRDVVIRTVMPGGVFGEVVLFERDTYPVTAIALKKCTLYEIRRSDFRALLAREEFRDGFLIHMARRLRYLADRILQLTASDVEERFLQFLQDQYGEKPEYTIHISKKDLAAAIGTTPETLSRLVTRLRKERKLTWKGRTLRLVAAAPRR